MARKKLNKKVALIGSVVFVLAAMAAILLFLRFGGNPQKFIKDGDAALKAAREAVDEQIKQREYGKAERSYHRARGRTRDDSLRVDILFKLVDFYLELDRWNNVRGCWDGIIRIDPANAKARFGQLEYFYIMADSGVLGAWKEVKEQAEEFIKVADNADLLDEDTAQWDVFEIQQERTAVQRLGPYLYLCSGRASLEVARSGALTDPEQTLTEAVEYLKKVQELEPDNIETYLYLAQAEIVKGEIFVSRGNFNEKDKAVEQAKQILEQAVEVAVDNPRAHINLLIMKFNLIPTDSITKAREQILALEPEYLALVQRFDSSAETFVTLARFYHHPILGTEYIDKAIEAIGRAMELDEENAAYAIIAANLHYHKFSIYGQGPEVYKAIEIAQNALTLSDTQDQPGPRQAANRRGRLLLYNFLANCYIEQVLEPCEVRTESQKQQWLTNAEQIVHEIEQLIGSGEDPQVIKWQGMLELARGNKDIAIRKLYATYEQLKASGRDDAQLSYALAKIFKDTSEVGAVVQFLTSALNANIDRAKPESRLDYVNVILKVNAWTPALANIDNFEEKFGASERSRALRIKTYIGARQFDEAEEELAKANHDDPNIIVLNMELMRARIKQIIRVMTQRRVGEKEDVDTQGEDQLMVAELKNYKSNLAKLVEKLLAVEPHSVQSLFIVDVCNDYIEENKIELAKNLVNKFLEYFPDNVDGMLYKQILSEPEPGNISQQRRKEVEKIALENIADPARRLFNLGVFYYQNNEPNQALVEFKKVIDIEALSQRADLELPAADQAKRVEGYQHLAAGYLLNIALEKKNWEMASSISNLAQQENADGCEGNFFNARVSMAKEQYRDAMVKLDECLRQRPVFSQAYMLRSNVNAILGKEDAAVEDARKAASLNPIDGSIAKVLAFALYRRNQKLGETISPDQMAETKTALLNAIAQNPGDIQLNSFYAEFISGEKPDNALAMRQRLLKVAPTVQNALLLGNMAMRRALEQTSEVQKEALFAIAASAYEQARAIDPQNRTVLDSYAEYYRITEQEERAEQLLRQSLDEELLWVHYYRAGRFENARGVLERLYQKQPNSANVLKGLLVVAEKTADKEAAKKYSEELLSIEDNTENRLLQTQIFLKIGLIKEAEYRLQSFRERYPNEPKAMLLEAWLAMKQGRLEDALELANKSLQSDQDNAVAWQLRGEINRFMANYDQAVIDLKRSRALSDDPLTRIALAKAYLRTGQNDSAITELKNAIEHPQAPEGARMVLEGAYERLGRRQELRKFYDETLEKLPDSVLWHNRAAAFAITEGDFKEAERLYELAWRKDKSDVDNSAEAFNGYLQALMSRGELDQLFEEAQKYVESKFAPVAFLGMAAVKLKLEDKATAIQYCRKAVDKAGTDDVLASWALQGMYSMLGADEVISYCKDRLRTNPDSLTANFTMYNLSRLNHQYNKALDYIDRCLQIVGPDSPDTLDFTLKMITVLQLAYNKTSDNNYLNRAITEYESLLAKVPNNTGILNNLAYMLAENNEKLAEALKYAERVYQISPNDPGFLDTYAYVLYKNGKYEEAGEFIQSALQQYEQNNASVPAVVYEHLGMIKEKLGAADQALDAYKQALETGADTLSKPVIERINNAVKRVSKQ